MPRLLLGLSFSLAMISNAAAQDDALAESLRTLDARVLVLGKVRDNPLAAMLSRASKADLREANQRDLKAWQLVKTRADWEKFRDVRIQALRDSLGSYPPAPKSLKSRVVRSRPGDGYHVDNVVYESRPGLLVAANVYRPAKPTASMPGVILGLSHQRPKNTGWRQDMAMTWARAGCVVIVPDHLGHGERRAHPFVTPNDYDKPFKLEQQDYHFRHDLGMQLHLLGDSLMGWLAYDLARGVDYLVGQPGVDAKRILIVSEPAGGGDVAGVAFALDPRITAAAIMNFGGPQPEAAFPFSPDAEQTFEFTGTASWETTRNLRHSARDGFLHWTIIASAAPRKLIYNHEFYWDHDHDPVWKRLKKIYGFYGADDALVGVAGRGFVSGSAPANTHWLPINRELLYPTLERWLAIPNPKKEYENRRDEAELLGFTPDVLREFGAKPTHEILSTLGKERAEAARAKLTALKPAARRVQLRKDWSSLLGAIEPKGPARLLKFPQDDLTMGNIRVERHALMVEPGIVVPMAMLIPPHRRGTRLPTIVAIAQGGKQAFLTARPNQIAAYLNAGFAVAMPDLRGTGETSPSDSRGRGSPGNTFAAGDLMVGQTAVGNKLRDLRSIWRWLKSHPEIDAKRLAVWGDSFTPTHDAERDLRVPHGIDRPEPSEPAGALLALLLALFEDDVRAVVAEGGLIDFQSTLASPFCYVPFDAVVPGAIAVGDIPGLLLGLTPSQLRLITPVDGQNRETTRLAQVAVYAPARSAFDSDSLQIDPTAPTPAALMRWLRAATLGADPEPRN